MRDCNQDTISKFFPDSSLDPRDGINVAQYIFTMKALCLLDVSSKIYGCSALVHHNKTTSSKQAEFEHNVSRGGQATSNFIYTHARAIAINWRWPALKLFPLSLT
jgi:hypothetical protein